MKQIITIVLLVFLMLWYAGIGKVRAVEHENETTLSTTEIKSLVDKGILKKSVNYNKVYFITNEVSYLIKRTYIPLVYKRDTLYDKGIQYYIK